MKVAWTAWIDGDGTEEAREIADAYRDAATIELGGVRCRIVAFNLIHGQRVTFTAEAVQVA